MKLLAIIEFVIILILGYIIYRLLIALYATEALSSYFNLIRELHNSI